jgi:hypothetical protein
VVAAVQRIAGPRQNRLLRAPSAQKIKKWKKKKNNKK